MFAYHPSSTSFFKSFPGQRGDRARAAPSAAAAEVELPLLQTRDLNLQTRYVTLQRPLHAKCNS